MATIGPVFAVYQVTYRAPGQAERTTRVSLSEGYTTWADIPTIIACATIGRQNADLITIVSAVLLPSISALDPLAGAE